MTTEVLVLDVFHRGRPLQGHDLERIRAALKDMDATGIVLFAPYRRGEAMQRVEGFEVWRAPRDRSPSGFRNLVAMARERGLRSGLCLGPPTALQRVFAVSAGLRTVSRVLDDGGLEDCSLWSAHGARTAAKWATVEVPLALGAAVGQQLLRLGGEVVATTVLARAFMQDPSGWWLAYREAARRSRQADRFRPDAADLRR